MSADKRVRPKDFNKVEAIVDGQRYAFEAVMLFWNEDVTDVARLISEASEKLKPVNSGIGFFGSPTWVLTGSMISGLVEGMASKSAAKEGLKLLRTAQARIASPTWPFLLCSEIENVEYPLPNIWSAVLEEENSDRWHVHNGDEFVIVRDGGGVRHLRFSAISSYRIISGV